MASPEPPALLQLHEPVVMRYLVTLPVEHIPVAVPDLRARRALALLDDLAQCRERRREILHGDRLATALAQVDVTDLTRRVPAEYDLLPQRGAQVPQAVLDRGVELADRGIAVGPCRGVRPGWLLDAQEQLQRIRAERGEADPHRPVAVRQRVGVGRQQLGRVEHRIAADGVEQVRRQQQMQHLLGKHAAHDLRRLDVARGVEGVQRAEVRRQRGVLQLDRPLQVRAQVLKRGDTGGGGRHGGPSSGAGGCTPACLEDRTAPGPVTRGARSPEMSHSGGPSCPAR
jgi:hypothetical protein